MNPLTPPHSTSPTSTTSSSSSETYPYPRSTSKHRSSSHFTSSNSSSSSFSTSSSPEAKRPRSGSSPKLTAATVPHFPTPALTPEYLPPSSARDSTFPSTSEHRDEGPKGFVKRDDLNRKAGERTQVNESQQVQQMDKDRFVNGLVGASVLAIESIWGPSAPTSTTQFSTPSSVLPLHYFVREVLRRSRTSCSTLQLCLYYLHKSRKPIRDAVALAQQSRQEIHKLAKLGEEQENKDEVLHQVQVENYVNSDCFNVEGESAVESLYPSPPESPDTPHLSSSSTSSSSDSPSTSSESLSTLITRLLSAQKSPLLCGRRMFLASLISASKYLQDRNYSNKAWSKISGLNVKEINENEREFLKLIGWELHLGSNDFARWVERLNTLTSSTGIGGGVRKGLERSSSEYSSPSQETITTTTTTQSRPTSSNLLRSKLALTRGNSAPQLVEQPLSKEFPIAQPHSSSSSSLNTPKPVVASTLVTATTPRRPTSEEEVELETTEEEDNTPKPVVVRKVRALPIRRHKVTLSTGIPSNWSVGGGFVRVEGEPRGSEMIHVH